MQKRGDGESSPNVKSVPTIRVKAKHAGVMHEIYISSEASFGQSLQACVSILDYLASLPRRSLLVRVSNHSFEGLWRVSV